MPLQCLWRDSVTLISTLLLTYLLTSTRITWSRSVRWCLAVGLACEDQRRLTGNGSALEALRDDALYKSTYFTLLLLQRRWRQVSRGCQSKASRKKYVLSLDLNTDSESTAFLYSLLFSTILTYLTLLVFSLLGFIWFLSDSLYFRKRGAYWDRLCRDVVGWLSRACTVAKQCILGLYYYGTLIGNPTPGIQWYNFRPPRVTPNWGMGPPWGTFCQITLTSCS